MPIINVTLIEGYDAEARRRLAQRLIDATTSVIQAPAELVTVTINEVKPSNYMPGRKNRTPGPAMTVQSNIVKAHLGAMENRDLAAARAFLATDFFMTLPGGISFSCMICR